MTKSPKVIQLLNILSKKEIDVLTKRLEKSHRQRLLALTEALLKLNNKGLDKKALYEHIFKDEYDSEKDYLLRNEFRLLGHQLEWILAESELKEQLEKNETAFHYYLLQSFQKRNALPLFQKEYATSYKYAVEHQDYYAAHNITGLNFVNFTQFHNLKERDITFVEKLNELGLVHLSCYYLTAFRQHQINHNYIHNHLLPFSSEEAPIEQEVVVNFKTYETDYSDYLFLKSKSFTVSLSEQTILLHQCLERAEHHFIKNKLLFLGEIKFCLSALAKNQSQLKRFDEANVYFERYFKICEEKSSPSFLLVMGDYIANQINLEQIEKAANLLEENRSTAYCIPKAKLRWQCLIAACFAFLENNQNLYNCLREQIDFPNIHTKYFFRFYHSIHAFLDGRNEDAYREMENLRHLTSKNNGKLNIHPIVNFFHRYFYTIHHHLIQDDNYQINLQNLLDDIQNYVVTVSPELRSYLPLLWLKRKLEKINLSSC